MRHVIYEILPVILSVVTLVRRVRPGFARDSGSPLFSLMTCPFFWMTIEMNVYKCLRKFK